MTENVSHTKLRILEMGVRLWRAGVEPTARRVAQELEMTHAGVLYHFKANNVSMRDAIAHHAVREGESHVIVELIARKHKAVSHLTDAEKMGHMALVSRN